ncbi:conserved exported hypothetical protein [Syntrophobacter sp. SbD1]|nr:conserved exported hypothetical protein [Syntrophobacter sp. SbD1]
MRRKLSIGELRINFALILLGGFLCQGFSIAAGSEPARNAGQIESVVIHVDEWAVYAPNLIFYFDTQMDKRKIETLKRTANQLRNKKALITYSSNGGPGEDKHILLSDIVAAGEKPTPEKPVREAVMPSGEAHGEPVRTLSEEQVSLTENIPDKPAPKQPAPREVKQSPKSGQSDPITREEISAFVRRLLYLNGTKDLAAVAPFYADKVDYYDRGIVSRDNVLRDLKYYYRNWAQIDTRMDGDVVMTGFEPEVRIVKFISSFSVKNEKKSIAGKTENIWTIQRINGELRLIDVKQKILTN